MTSHDTEEVDVDSVDDLLSLLNDWKPRSRANAPSQRQEPAKFKVSRLHTPLSPDESGDGEAKNKEDEDSDGRDLIDDLLKYMQSPLWSIPMRSFVDEHCFIFKEDDENSLVAMELHQEFSTLVDSVLQAFLEQMGVTEDMFVKACEKADINAPCNRYVFEQILAGDDFLVFKEIMLKRKRQLEKTARTSSANAPRSVSVVSPRLVESGLPEDANDAEVKQVNNNLFQGFRPSRTKSAGRVRTSEGSGVTSPGGAEKEEVAGGGFQRRQTSHSREQRENSLDSPSPSRNRKTPSASPSGRVIAFGGGNGSGEEGGMPVLMMKGSAKPMSLSSPRSGELRARKALSIYLKKDPRRPLRNVKKARGSRGSIYSPSSKEKVFPKKDKNPSGSGPEALDVGAAGKRVVPSHRATSNQPKPQASTSSESRIPSSNVVPKETTSTAVGSEAVTPATPPGLTAASQVAKPAPGTPEQGDIKGWEKVGVIGAGAHGKVYLGKLKGGQEVAVKHVELYLVDDGENNKILQQFENEIVLMKSLRHANIVRYYGTERSGSELNIFLEYVPGGSLARQLRTKGKMDEWDIRKVTYQILNGLDYLHEARIIHRDIKAANILMDAKYGIVKLADFGSSRKLEDIFTLSGEFHSVKGTPFWMAPEVICGSSYGRKSDIWSVGCVAIEMMTAKAPWSDECESFSNHFAIMYHIVNADRGPNIPPNASKDAVDFINRCFIRDPEARPAASDLLQHPWMQGIKEKLNLPVVSKE